MSASPWSLPFDGESYDAPRDSARSSSRLTRSFCAAVYELMRDGRWRTHWQIKDALWQRWQIQASETSVSARLRDLRKIRFGSHLVERERIDGGLYAYRLVAHR